MNKKALSPLVATILLIAFAIALGVVVMNWGKTYIEEKAEFTTGPSDESACHIMKLTIIKVAGQDKICYNSERNVIQVFLENSPDSEIDNLNVRLIGTEGIETINSVLDQKLDRAAAANIEFNYPSSIGTIQQIKFIPTVDSEDGLIICSSSEVVSENIIPC